MPDLIFAFDKEKAVETILYLAKRMRNPTSHGIGKLMYFADKTSLERYGRFICGDDYCAMEWGPVPSCTYDLLKEAKRGGEFPFKVVGYTVIPSRKADTDLLSESDIECLNSSIQLYGNAPMWKLHEDSADEAYHHAWDSRGNSGSVRMPIEDIARLLDSPDKLLNYLACKDSE